VSIVAIAEFQRLSTRRAQARPRNPGAEPDRGILAPWASTNCMRALEQGSPVCPLGASCQQCCEGSGVVGLRAGRQRGKPPSRGVRNHGDSARAGPRGMRLPCSQLRMVSDGKRQPCGGFKRFRRARPAQVAHQRQRYRPAGRRKSSQPRPQSSPARAETPARPAIRRSVRPFSRKRCISTQPRIVGDALRPD